MSRIQFVLRHQLINNYLTKESFIHSQKDIAVLKLFNRSELSDLSRLLEEYQLNAEDRDEVFYEIAYAMGLFMHKHGIFNLDDMACHVKGIEHIHFLNLQVSMHLNDDARALNVFKLKNPNLYKGLKESFFPRDVD